MRAIWAGLINLAIYIGNIVYKNRRKRGEKEHPVGLPREAQYYWRMVRDSNPRWSCPHNGFQDRRIRPLCQPSETVSVGLSTYGFGVSHDTVMFTLHFADARSQDTHASTRSANHPKLCPSVLQPMVLVALSQ